MHVEVSGLGADYERSRHPNIAHLHVNLPTTMYLGRHGLLSCQPCQPVRRDEAVAAQHAVHAGLSALANGPVEPKCSHRSIFQQAAETYGYILSNAQVKKR